MLSIVEFWSLTFFKSLGIFVWLCLDQQKNCFDNIFNGRIYQIELRKDQVEQRISTLSAKPNPVFQGVFVAEIPGETNLGINFWWWEEAAAARRTGDVVHVVQYSTVYYRTVQYGAVEFCTTD